MVFMMKIREKIPPKSFKSTSGNAKGCIVDSYAVISLLTLGWLFISPLWTTLVERRPFLKDRLRDNEDTGIFSPYVFSRTVSVSNKNLQGDGLQLHIQKLYEATPVL